MASDPPGSSPASSKSESVQPSKEDAETTATRKELRNTSISGSNNDALRSSTPEVSEEKVASRDQISSPKKKRAHDQVDDDPTATSNSLNAPDPGPFGYDLANIIDHEKGRAPSLEPEKKRQRDELAANKEAAGEQGTGRDSPGPPQETGSAHVSRPYQTTSRAEDKSETVPPAKPSLTFANSSLSGFGASSSPFSALSGSSKGSVFGNAASKEPPAGAPAQKPTLNFSQASGASPFSGLASTSTSGFVGSFSSPFAGSSLGKLSSFAKPGESLTSDKKPRAFGAPDSDVEESDEDEDSDNKASSEDGEGDEKDDTQMPGDDKKKPKLQKVAVDTGEAGEATVVQVRSKMYVIDNDNKDAGWKERGAGALKINVPASCVDFDDNGTPISGSFDASGLDEGDSGGSFKGARLILRQDQTHRLLLNTVLLPAMTFQEKASLKAVNVLFTAFDANDEGDTPRPFSVNMKMSAASAKTFLNELGLIQRELQGV